MNHMARLLCYERLLARVQYIVVPSTGAAEQRRYGGGGDMATAIERVARRAGVVH